MKTWHRKFWPKTMLPLSNGSSVMEVKTIRSLIGLVTEKHKEFVSGWQRFRRILISPCAELAPYICTLCRCWVHFMQNWLTKHQLDTFAKYVKEMNFKIIWIIWKNKILQIDLFLKEENIIEIHNIIKSLLIVFCCSLLSKEYVLEALLTNSQLVTALQSKSISEMNFTNIC